MWAICVGGFWLCYWVTIPKSHQNQHFTTTQRNTIKFHDSTATSLFPIIQKWHCFSRKPLGETKGLTAGLGAILDQAAGHEPTLSAACQGCLPLQQQAQWMPVRYLVLEEHIIDWLEERLASLKRFNQLVICFSLLSFFVKMTVSLDISTLWVSQLGNMLISYPHAPVS